MNIQYPVYECRMTVRAFRIKKITMDVRRGYILSPDHSIVEPLWVSQTWVDQNRPEPGDYYVIYEDGTTNCLKGKVFEATHTLVHEAKREPEPASTATLQDEIACLREQVKQLLDSRHAPPITSETGYSVGYPGNSITKDSLF